MPIIIKRLTSLEPSKTYHQDCTGNYVNVCNSSLGLYCNTAQNFSAGNRPLPSVNNTCDCQPGFVFDNTQCGMLNV